NHWFCPARLVFEHEVNAQWRDRKLRIDSACKGMDQLGPCRIIEPQRRPAGTAKPPLSARQAAAFMLLVGDARAVDPQIVCAIDLERRRVGAKVDRIAATGLLLPADRAIAMLIGHPRVPPNREAYSAAAAGAF